MLYLSSAPLNFIMKGEIIKPFFFFFFFFFLSFSFKPPACPDWPDDATRSSPIDLLTFLGSTLVLGMKKKVILV